MINTDDQILEACQKYGAQRVYDAAYSFMSRNLSALPAIGLQNPSGVGEADYIGSKVFKIMGGVDRANDLTDITINLAKTKPHGMTGLKNALKPDQDKLDCHVQIRCKSLDKSVWKHLAEQDGLTLSEWIVKNLNK